MHRPLIAAHHVRPIPENLRTATATPSQRSGWSSFPGRRSAQPASGANNNNNNNSDTVFVRTGGNALQAVSREAAQDQGLLAVTVPIGTKSGHKIMVAVPDGSGRLVEAVVPPGVFEGHTFLVRIPPLTEQEQEAALTMMSDGTRPASWVPPHAGYMVPYEGGNIPTAQATIAPPSTTVPGRDVNVQTAQAWQPQPPPPNNNPYTSSAPAAQHHLPAARPFSQALDGPRSRSNPNETAPNASSSDNDDDDLVLVRVPPGVMPGTAIRVRVDDGRIIEATVPTEPGVAEFYVRVPPQHQSQNQQNWHDHPLAIAPMAVGPFFL